MKTNQKMKKSKTFHTIANALLLASLFLAGCSAEDTDRIHGGGSSMELNTPLTITSASLETEVLTRATETIASGSIGVFLEQSDAYTAVDNNQYTYAGGQWVSTAPILLGGQSAMISAYYPYTAAYNDGKAIPVVSTVYDQGTDLSYAREQVKDGTINNRNIEFHMKRAYSRLKIRLRRTDYPGTCKVTKVVLRNILKSTTLNIAKADYAVKNASLTDEVSFERELTLGESSAYTDWTDYLLIPCTIVTGGGIIVEVTVDGQKMTRTINVVSGLLEAGKYSSVGLTLRGSGITVGQVTTEEWGPPTNLGDWTPLPNPI